MAFIVLICHNYRLPSDFTSSLKKKFNDKKYTVNTTSVDSMSALAEPEKRKSWLEYLQDCMYFPFVVCVCRVQCVASHAQRGDLDKTVPRSVSVTTTASVCRPLESVSAALDSLESGKSNFSFKFQGTDYRITESKQFVFYDTYMNKIYKCTYR